MKPYPPIAPGFLLVSLRAGQLVAAVNAVASYYGGNLAGGNCMFSSYSLPQGTYGTAIAGPNWSSAAMCGVCLNVRGPKGSIKAMVVDQCPGCQANQLDLFQDAFGQVGDPNTGVIGVSWEAVACGIGQPLRVRNKDGTSKFWFAMQVVNCNQKVIALEVSTNGGGSWQPTVRRDYNYFEKSGGGGFGADTMIVRVTCSNGAKVTLQNVGVGAGASFSAPGNC